MAWDKLIGGPVNVDLTDGANPVAEQLWHNDQTIIAFASEKMSNFFDGICVPKEDRSPFCCHFTSLTNLCDASIHYCPRTFNYVGKEGAGDVDTPHHQLTDVNEESPEEVLQNRLQKLADDMFFPENVNEQLCRISTAQEQKQPAKLPTKKALPNPYDLLQVVEAMLKCNSKSLCSHLFWLPVQSWNCKKDLSRDQYHMIERLNLWCPVGSFLPNQCKTRLAIHQVNLVRKTHQILFQC